MSWDNSVFCFIRGSFETLALLQPPFVRQFVRERLLIREAGVGTRLRMGGFTS